jgi:hypothetical protein
VWTGFLSSQQLRWLYLPDDILGLKDHEWQLVPLVHPCLWGTSQWAILLVVLALFASFISHHSSAFFRGMRLIDFETQLTAFLHPGSLVSCHNFLILFLYFNSRLGQVDRCLILTRWSYWSTAYMPKQ